jgi:glutamate synthase (NADPH) small chain
LETIFYSYIRLNLKKIATIITISNMRRGQSLVVWNISEGRECARKVDEFLMGESLLEGKDGGKN